MVATWITDSPQTTATISFYGSSPYRAGTSVISTVTFLDDNGQPYDPVTVQVSAGSRCSTPTPDVYGQPGSLILRSGVGVYAYPISTATATGLLELWTAQWAAGDANGNPTYVQSADFTVTADVFALQTVYPPSGQARYGTARYGIARYN